MFAVVQLPQFALQAVLRQEPELWSEPVALIDPAQTTPTVVDLTAAAREQGVAAGLTPTQAMARCAGVRVRHRSTVREAAATEAMLQCGYGFSPHMEATAPGVMTLDLRALLRLRDASPEAHLRWAGELRAALAKQGLKAAVGLAATPGVARHAARWGDGLQLVTEPRAFLTTLPVGALGPSSDVALVLHKWGVRTVGELLALGLEALTERLGLEALALWAAAATDTIRPLRWVQPAETYEESFDFENPIETAEPLLFVLRRFGGQLCPRLALAGLAAEMVVLTLRLESGAVIGRRLRVPEPTRHEDILHRMLATHIEGLRTDAPICAVTLRLETTRPVQRQFGLFEAALRDPHQFQETLARLSALLGADRVGTPVREDSHRPDAFRMVPPDFENAPAVTGPRPPFEPVPWRRLRPAPEAVVEVVGDQPVAIRCSVARGRLKLTVGPWLASGHWWEGGGWQRETWDVATVQGPVLRLVRQAGGWSVEAVAD
jgi:protein ImuB